MRKQAGIIVAAFLYYSGLTGLARWLMQRKGPRLIILNYHRASTGDLLRHLRYLQRHYRVLHLEEALEELYQSDSQREHAGDQRTLLAVTFDDGYRDAYTHAFALADKLQIPVTIFLIPGYIENQKRFWWKEGHSLAQHTPVEQVKIDECIYQLAYPAEREQLARIIDHSLRYARSVTEREETLRTWSHLLLGNELQPAADDERAIDWQEAQEMGKSDYISFGAHTMHHPVLSYLDNLLELQYEVRECRQKLEQSLDRPVNLFAYPIGKSEHIGEATLHAVKGAGYRWAVTTDYGVNTPESHPHQLTRIPSDVSRHWLVMAAEISGIWSLLSPVWKKLLNKDAQI